MNNKLLSFLAGIGILAIVFVACANTPSTNIDSSTDFIKIGQTYKTQFEGNYYRIKIIEKSGNWAKTETKKGWNAQGGRDSETENMWINLAQLTYIK